MPSPSSASADSAAARPAAAPAATRLRRFTWLVLPVACHLAFSWIGFNPTDDGWLPAVARRLAEGEVPHRDFIFVRPALSAWLQVPLIWWGGEHVIWLSRLWGWLMLAATCWLWSGRVARDTPPLRFALYATALLCSAHAFPVMAWHSIDGMFFATLAVALLERDTPGRRRAAFFAVGLAALCRQNFALFAPLLLLGAGGSPRTWFVAGFWSALPTLLYALGIGAAGGLRDFVQQLAATRGSFGAAAFFRYGPEPVFWAGLAGGTVGAWLLPRMGRATHPLARNAPLALFVAVVGVLAVCLWREPEHFNTATLGLFALVLALGLGAVARGVSPADRLTLVAAPALAWVTATSLGYNTPALASGVLLLALWRLLELHRGAPLPARPALACAVLAAVGVSATFAHARQAFPYRDRPVEELRHDAGDALRGAAGLRTNRLTFATLHDLRSVAEGFEREQRRYVVLTDCAAWWIRSPSRNPLPSDWPQETELGHSPELFRRLLASLSELGPDARIVVQKFLIADYYWRREPVPEGLSFYYAQTWVRRYCRKAGETPFFEIYLPPPRGSVRPPEPAPRPPR